MLNLFGPDPTFAAPPVQILVGTTNIRLKIDKRGNVGNGTSLAPFMTQYLKEREWVPRLSSYVTINNYSVYDEKTGYASLPRYVLDKLTEYLVTHGVNFELAQVAPVKPRPIKLKIKKNFSPREDQPKVIEFMTSERAYKPISAQTGIGKQCTNSTPIKIPGGWTTHGAVKVGDTVTAWDGTPSCVNGVFPQGLQDVFRVHFADGRSLDVGGEHLWTILYSTKHGIRSDVVSTLNLMDILQNPNTPGSVHIPLCESELLEDIDLPNDPYFLGFHLGDVAAAQIPLKYLNASHDQRLKLLQGILDNDGMPNNFGVGFCTTSFRLASVVQYLVYSIGGTCSIENVAFGGSVFQKLDIRYKYPRLLFSMEKKRDFFSNTDHYSENLKLQVTAVVPLPEKEECTCISIDHPDQLYVTKDFIVTHNTFCAEVAICEMGLTTMVVLNSLIDQWYKSLRQHTNIASHEIYVVQGFEPLRKLWEAIKNGYRPKIVIFSTRTLVSYAVNPKGQYELLPSYAKFQEILGIGMKIMDEVHLGFHANTKVDLVSNIAHNIYLSATYQRNHYQGKRIFDMVFPRELRFGEEFQKKFTTVHMLRYRLGIPPDDCGRMRSPKGYNHALYENYLRRRPQYFNDFMESVVVPVVEMFYLPVRKPGQLFLLLCQTRKFALKMEEYLKKWFAGRGTVAVYFSGEKGKNGADKNLLADIIISTHKSCGTGRDIKNLKTCLNTVSFASAPLSSQVLGRLREIPGEDTIFVDVWNMDVGSHSSHRDSRMEVYRNKALKLFESTLR